MKQLKKAAVKVYQKIHLSLGGKGIGKILPTQKIDRFLKKFLRSNYCIVEGHKLFLGEKDTIGYSVVCYEPMEIKLIKQNIKKGDIVLDLGANIGYYSLLFAKLVGPQGHVYAFEPEPRNVELLKKNIKINNYKNITVFPYAVLNKESKLKLYLNEENKGDHKLFNDGKNQKFIECRVISLDTLLKNKKIDFIKADIQGAEYGALLGAKKLISQNYKLKILSEFWPFGINNTYGSSTEYLSFLEKQGFKIFWINERKKKLKLTSATELLNLFPEKEFNKNGDTIQTNIFCFRE